MGGCQSKDVSNVATPGEEQPPLEYHVESKSKSSHEREIDTKSVRDAKNIWKEKEKKAMESRTEMLNQNAQKTLKQSNNNNSNRFLTQSNHSTMHEDADLHDPKLRILWSDIQVTASTAEECVLGQGSFGVVVRGIWKRNNREIDVAVKVLTKSNSRIANDKNFDEACKNAWSEVELMKNAERNLANSDCIVRAYGVAEGILPFKLTKLFNLPPKDEGVGIIMRFEGGGSLESLVHGSDMKPLNLQEKIRLLTGIAEALVELHSSGIIHADIKSGNVLLSHHVPPEIRMADFGMSVLKDPNANSLGASSLLMTSHTRGTPVYSAPETLVNPYEENFDGTVAQCSRKTDIYSFAILAWEVLSRQRPFPDMKNETMLCGKVHKGIRPPLDQLPVDTPPTIVSMIEACWDKDRSVRKSAVECSATLRSSFDFLSTGNFDIFFSHAWTMKPFLSHVYHYLTKLGYRVWYDQNEMGHDIIQSMRKGIQSSKVVISCINDTYQTRQSCMFELREAAANDKSIISLILDDNPLAWATQEVQDLCELKTKLYVNISDVANLKWQEETTHTPEVMELLKLRLQPLLRLLKEHDVVPSMSSSSLSSPSGVNSRPSFSTPPAFPAQVRLSQKKSPPMTAQPSSKDLNGRTAPELTMWVKPNCPGLQVKLRPQPSTLEKPVGAIKSDTQIEVMRELVLGYYKLADGSGFVNSVLPGVTWIVLETTSKKNAPRVQTPSIRISPNSSGATNNSTGSQSQPKASGSHGTSAATGTTLKHAASEPSLIVKANPPVSAVSTSTPAAPKKVENASQIHGSTGEMKPVPLSQVKPDAKKSCDSNFGDPSLVKPPDGGSKPNSRSATPTRTSPTRPKSEGFSSAVSAQTSVNIKKSTEIKLDKEINSSSSSNSKPPLSINTNLSPPAGAHSTPIPSPSPASVSSQSPAKSKKVPVAPIANINANGIASSPSSVDSAMPIPPPATKKIITADKIPESTERIIKASK